MKTILAKLNDTTKKAAFPDAVVDKLWILSLRRLQIVAPKTAAAHGFIPLTLTIYFSGYCMRTIVKEILG